MVSVDVKPHVSFPFLFWGCTFDGVYIPRINSYARWNYRRRFRSLLLCPLSVEPHHFPLFVDSLLEKTQKKTERFDLKYPVNRAGRIRAKHIHQIKRKKKKKRCPIRSSLLFMFEEVWEKKRNWMNREDRNWKGRIPFSRRRMESHIIILVDSRLNTGNLW